MDKPTTSAPAQHRACYISTNSGTTQNACGSSRRCQSNPLPRRRPPLSLPHTATQVSQTIYDFVAKNR